MKALTKNHFLPYEEFINVSNIASELMDNPLMSKDIWRTVEDLGLKINQHCRVLSINFRLIRQDWLKVLLKLYVLVRSSRNISVGNIKTDIVNIGKFSEFMRNKSIFNSSQIDNQVFEEFNDYLKMIKLSDNTIRGYNITLNNFFKLCREEQWLQVNTYWFKGRSRQEAPKSKKIDYIPEEVWQQLDENLHHLPEPLQRMVIVIRSTGLRIGELLNLPFDCLRQRDNQWRLRFLTEKYQTIDEIPICEELVVVIKEQQEYIKQHFADNYANLFNGSSKNYYSPTPNVMNSDTFNQWLNRIAKKHNIQTNEGIVWHFRSHQFRKTVATLMTNAGVRDLIIQKYLRHRSSNMQDYYKHLLKEVLGEEYQELMKETSYVDSTGKLVAKHHTRSPITEIIRQRMHEVTTQYGECHRPVLKSSCQTINACWRCEHWLTSTNDLSALKEDLHKVEEEIDITSKLGMFRQQQGLTTDRNNLVIRIQGLEIIDEKN